MSEELKIPRVLHIGPYVYRVNTPELIDPADTSRIGLCDPLRHVIHLAKSIPRDLQRANLLHELLHATSDAFGLGLDDEDDMVDRIAVALLMLFDQNPSVLGTLFDYTPGQEPKEEE